MLSRALFSGLVVVVAFFVKTAYDAGEFKTLEPHGAEDCFLVKGAPGAEDLEAAPDGTIFVSSDDRAWSRGLGLVSSRPVREAIAAQAQQGSLLVLRDAQGAQPRLEALELADFSSPDLHPHGIRYDAASGRLWVVNHARDGDRVEVFDVDAAAGRATHVRSLQHPLFRNLNEIAVGAAGDFYVTNWMYYDHGTLLNVVESFGQRPWGNVVRCEPGPGLRPRCAVAADGIATPNGLALLGGGGEQLLVVSAIGHRFLTFDRDAASGALSLAAEADSLGSTCDNAFLAPDDGLVYAGCHPQVLTFVRHSQQPERHIAPSQVIAFDPATGEATELLLSLGRELSASSAAVVAGERMFVGGVFDDGVLVCPRPGR